MTDINKFITKMAFIIGIKDEPHLTKATEYMRLLQQKLKIPLSEQLKSYICLEIAAETLGVQFDRAQVLNSTTKGKYMKSLILIKNLLQIECTKSIPEICVQLGCQDASKIAYKLYEKYKQFDKLERDFNHPQYAVAAVYTICKLKKIPVQKKDCVSLSYLPPQQWTKLEDEFKQFAENNLESIKTINKIPKSKKTCFKNVEEKAKELEKVVVGKKIEESSVESYEDWRNRILKEAYEHINKKNRV